MPLIGTKGVASAQGFGMFLGKSSYWLGLLGGTSDNIASSVAFDSSGNVYLVGYSNAASGTYAVQLAKYNLSGVIQWQRTLGFSRASYGTSIAMDSSANLYICGYFDNRDIGNSNDFIVAKYDTSGSLQWQRRLGDGASDTLGGIAVDGSSNVYICGTSNASGNNDFIIAKFNTSGTIQWQRSLGGSGNDTGGGIALDSSANVYVGGWSTTPGGFWFQIAKYNTSGTIQWQRRLGGSGTNQGGGVAVDSSGNSYITGYTTAGVLTEIQIAKYNTSGAIQWQRKLGGVGGNGAVGSGIATDSSGNVYINGRVEQSANNNFIIAKYNTSGSIQWQRRLGSATLADEGAGIAVDSAGNMYPCGFSSARGASDFLFAKLPGDGALTGTYTVGGYSIVYASTSLTDGATSLTDAASSLTDATSTLAVATASLTSSTSTLTSSVTTI